MAAFQMRWSFSMNRQLFRKGSDVSVHWKINNYLFRFSPPFFPLPHARHLFKYVAKIETFASYDKMHVHSYSVQRLPQRHLCLHTLIRRHGLIISITPTVILITSTHNTVFKYSLHLFTECIHLIVLKM